MLAKIKGLKSRGEKKKKRKNSKNFGLLVLPEEYVRERTTT